MLVIAGALACVCGAASAKPRHCIFRVHAEANSRDSDVFASAVHAKLSGKDVAIEKIPRISEQDVVAFMPYPRSNGGFVFVFINGRAISEMEIDKRITDGKIYLASGLTNADIELMKKDWKLIGKKKR